MLTGKACILFYFFLSFNLKYYLFPLSYGSDSSIKLRINIIFNDMELYSSQLYFLVLVFGLCRSILI